MSKIITRLSNPSLSISKQHLAVIIRDLQASTKKIFQKSKLGKVFVYFWLIIESYRDAYLFDGCSVTCDIVLEIVRCVRSSFALVDIRLQFSLITIALGPNHDDFLLIRSDALQEKLNNLYSDEWIEVPVMIDVNANEPRLCTAEEVQSVQICLQQTFMLIRHSSPSYFPITASSEFDNFVGFPFVAGWLLGYPCVYRSSNPKHKIEKDCNESSAPLNGSALSMATLQKYSIHAKINDEAALIINDRKGDSSSRKHSGGSKSTQSSCDPSSSSRYDSTDIDLFEFTVPVALVVAETRIILEDWISKKTKRFQHLADGCEADAGSICFVQSCAVHIEEITLPSVTL
jgi:Domain of unknown function (DUF4504)